MRASVCPPPHALARAAATNTPNAILREVDNLQQFRLVQEHTDLLVLQLQFKSPASDAVLKDLQTQLLLHTGEPLTLRIELVDGFENEALKFRAFISQLSER